MSAKSCRNRVALGSTLSNFRERLIVVGPLDDILGANLRIIDPCQAAAGRGGGSRNEIRRRSGHD